MIGDFDVELAHEFFQGFVNHALVTLHVDNLRGDNAHHQCETVFKAFARALRWRWNRRALPAWFRAPRAPVALSGPTSCTEVSLRFPLRRRELTCRHKP